MFSSDWRMPRNVLLYFGQIQFLRHVTIRRFSFNVTTMPLTWAIITRGAYTLKFSEHESVNDNLIHVKHPYLFKLPYSWS